MKPLISKLPATSILSPKFSYVPAAQQNLEATFKRIRREMAEQDKLPQNVRTLQAKKIRP